MLFVSSHISFSTQYTFVHAVYLDWNWMKPDTIVTHSGLYRNLQRGTLGVWGFSQWDSGAAPQWEVRGKTPPEAGRFPMNFLVKLCNIHSIVAIGYFLFLYFCFGNHVHMDNNFFRVLGRVSLRSKWYVDRCSRRVLLRHWCGCQTLDLGVYKSNDLHIN